MLHAQVCAFAAHTNLREVASSQVLVAVLLIEGVDSPVAVLDEVVAPTSFHCGSSERAKPAEEGHWQDFLAVGKEADLCSLVEGNSRLVGERRLVVRDSAQLVHLKEIV